MIDSFLTGFDDELEKAAVAASAIKGLAERAVTAISGKAEHATNAVGNALKGQLAGLGIKRYAGHLRPDDITLPQLAKRYARHPISTFREAAGQQGPLGIGATTAFTASELPNIRSKDPGTRGASIGRSAATMAVGLGMPMRGVRIVPNMVAWHLLSKGGEKGGKAIAERLAARKALASADQGSAITNSLIGPHRMGF